MAKAVTPDSVIIEFDRALRTLFASARSVRPVPGDTQPELGLDIRQRHHVVDARQSLW
jgi:ubiquinone biosynthesis monooxygenase Coq7